MSATDASPTIIPSSVSAWEELGRDIFSRRQSQQAAKGAVPYQVSLERIGARTISVDRLTCAPTAAEVAAIAERVGARRDPPRRFYGWAVAETEKVIQIDGRVNATPLPYNPYHADIVLPDAAVESEEAQRQYAAKLARMSEWRPRPQPED